MAFTPFLQNNPSTGTKRALGPTPAPAPVGLAAGTAPADPYKWQKASTAQYDGTSWGLFSQTPYAGTSTNSANPENSFNGEWAPDGYDAGWYSDNGIMNWALRDDKGDIINTWSGPMRDSLNSEDYATIAAGLTAGYGIAGGFTGLAGGAASGAGATAAELGSLGTAVGGDALGASLAGGVGDASLLTAGATSGATLSSAAAPTIAGGFEGLAAGSLGSGAYGAALAPYIGLTSQAVASGPAGPQASSPASTIGNVVAKNPLATATLVSALTGGGGGGAPTLDASSAAAQQAAASKDASLFDTYLNRPNQVTPQGTLEWTLKPGADPKNPQPGDWVQTTKLTDTGQKLLNADQQLQLGLSGAGQSALDRVNGTLNQPLDTSGLAQMGQVSDFNGAERQRIEDALLARLNPGFAQDEEAMRSRTLNTGFELGSEGSQREQFRLDQAKNDARLAAIAQAGGEAERLSNISRSNATFQNQSRQQGLEEILAQRALPLNELNAIRNGTQVQQPQFSPVSQSNTAAAPVMEALMAQLKGQQANAANKQSGYNALLASLAQLGGSYFGS